MLFVGLFGLTEMILFSLSLKTNLFTDPFQGDIPSQNVDATTKEEDRDIISTACRALESIAMEIFARSGWQFSNMQCLLSVSHL